MDYLHGRYNNYRMAIKVRSKSLLFLWVIALVSCWFHVVYVGIDLTLQPPRNVHSVDPTHRSNFFGQTFASSPFSIPRRIFTRSSDGSLFIFSALERCPAAKTKTLLLNAWLIIKTPPRNRSQRTSEGITTSPIFCCFLLPNRSTMSSEATSRLEINGNARLTARKLECAVPVTGSYAVTVMSVPVDTGFTENNDIQNGTITTNSTKTNSTINKLAPNKLPPDSCPSSLDHYILPATPLIPETYTHLNEAESTKIDQNCIIENKRNIRVDQHEKFSFAICAKLAFGNLDSHLLIEWMEYNLKMGVSKIIVYTYNLNSQAARVLRHYETKGNVVTLPFDMPCPNNPKRQPGEKRYQSWNDEQVALYDCYERLRLYKYVALNTDNLFFTPQVVLFDCYERLRLYKYVAVVDFDEFIVPTQDQNFNELMTRIQKEAPNASKFVFDIMYHITDWAGNVTKGADTILALTYREHTPPTYANVKCVTLPGRTTIEGTWTHGVPSLLPPYTSYKVPDRFAAISHYRSCRGSWKTSCFQQKRTNTSEIFRLIDEPLRNAILQKKKLLLL